MAKMDKIKFLSTITDDQGSPYVTEADLATTALKNPHALSIGEKSYDGSIAVSVTAADLGIANALHFIGETTTALTDGTTTATVIISGASKTPISGDVVLCGSKEFIWNGSAWKELGDGSSHALKTIKIIAGEGLTDGGNLNADVTLNVGEGNGIIVTADAIAAKAGNGITVDVTGINHADTSSQSSVTANGRKYITGVTLDTYGHVTGLTTGTEAVIDTDTWRKIQLNGVDKLGSGTTTNPLNIKAGDYVTITENNGTFTFNSTDTNTKVTSVDNHYAPAADSTKELSVDANSTTSATWGLTDLVTGVNIQRDAKGHVTGVTVDSIQLPSKPESGVTSLIDGEGENSIVQVTDSEDDKNIAISTGSIALGNSSSAGCCGFRISSIDATTEDADTKFNIAIDGNHAATSYAVGDQLTIRLQSYYHDIVGDGIETITYDETNDKTIFKINGFELYEGDFNDDGSPKLYEPLPDEFIDDCNTICVAAKPTVGNILLTTAPSFAFGNEARASGNYALALGEKAIAGGKHAYAIGKATYAGYSAHAEGQYTKARGIAAHAEGSSSKALSDFAHAEGEGAMATGGWGAHAEGHRTKALHQAAHAEGERTTADGQASHAEGTKTIATGDYSHAEGNESVASGEASHAEGYQTTAEGYASHTEGKSTSAKYKYTHAEGYNTRAGFDRTDKYTDANGNMEGGIAAHAEGRDTKAFAQASHAEGYQTTAKGYASHTEGQGTVATTDNQHVQGKYNYLYNQGKDTETSGDFAHVVGWGGSDTSRRNIHTLSTSGDAVYAGNVTAKNNIVLTSTQVIGSFKISSSDWSTLTGNDTYTAQATVEPTDALTYPLTDNSIVQFMMDTLADNNNIGVAKVDTKTSGTTYKPKITFYAITRPSSSVTVTGKVVCFNVGV